MAKEYLDKDGLLYFWQKIKSNFVTDVTYDSTNKKIQKTKAGSTSDVVTLATVATSGSYNDLSNKPTIPTLQNVFGKVKVGSSTIEADTTQDTLELAAGSNVSLTADTTNDKVTISATDTTYSDATTSVHGLMSTSDKTKLNGIATGAEVNQNAFSNVTVGDTTLAADSKTDTLTLVAGSNISLQASDINDTITIDTTGVVTVKAYGTLFTASIAAIKGAADGICPLNSSSKIDSTYLPSYVDDVVEAYPRSGATELSSTWLSLTSGGSALTPETGKIYILMADTTSYATNTQFRWSGTAYVKMLDGGVTSITNAEIDTIVAS